MLHDRKRIFLLILLIAIVLRLPSLWMPVLDVDETQFAGFANAIIDGGKPYIASVDTKPPGIYYFFAAIFFLFGKNNMIAVHAATIICAWLTAIFCYLIADRIYGRRPAFWAAIFYTVFTTAYFPKQIATSIVPIMLLPLTASIYFLVLWENTITRLTSPLLCKEGMGEVGLPHPALPLQRGGFYEYAFLSGLLFGVACLFKYQAGINLIIVALYLIPVRSILKRDSIRQNISAFAFFLLGGLLVGAALALAFYLSGVWDAFLYWSIKGSLWYSTITAGLVDTWGAFSRTANKVIISSFLLWALGAWRILRIISAGMRRQGLSATPSECLIILWLVLTIIPIFTGGRFYAHYFLQMFPPLCVIASREIADLLDEVKMFGSRIARYCAYGALIGGVVLPAIFFFGMRLMHDRVCPLIDEENPKIYEPIGRYVKKHSDPGDRVYVWGFATAVYYYSDRDSASRFLWSDLQSGRISGIDRSRDPSFDSAKYVRKDSWNFLMQDLRENMPLYIIDTSPGNYHNYGIYPIAKYPLFADFLKYNYHFEANVNNAYMYRRNVDE